MRILPAALKERLAGGATTLCHVWLLTRADGLRMGFTDHDCDLDVDGVTARAATGFRGTDLAERLGLSVTGGEVAGALSDDAICETDVLKGLYDAARVDIYLVDWSDPALKLHLRRAFIGEITREDGAFRAELRSIAHRLDETRGRLFAPHCTADLGDAACGIDLAAPARSAIGTVTLVETGDAFLATGLAGFSAGSLAHGRLQWLSGANKPDACEVRGHGVRGSETALTLWHPPVHQMGVGDRFRVTIGCDKQFATCCDRFGNSLNFRGFPHMPGNDFVLSYPTIGAGS